MAAEVCVVGTKISVNGVIIKFVLFVKMCCYVIIGVVVTLWALPAAWLI